MSVKYLDKFGRHWYDIYINNQRKREKSITYTPKYP